MLRHIIRKAKNFLLIQKSRVIYASAFVAKRYVHQRNVHRILEIVSPRFLMASVVLPIMNVVRKSFSVNQNPGLKIISFPPTKIIQTIHPTKLVTDHVSLIYFRISSVMRTQKMIPIKSHQNSRQIIHRRKTTVFQSVLLAKRVSLTQSETV